VNWQRAAALLYGDWGTSKAYVIGLAFVVAGYSSLPIIAAVSALTALVGYNYSIVCKYFPDGGGVYSAARDQSRTVAVVGALLLIAGFTVTASLNAWAALEYFHVPKALIGGTSVALILAIAGTNYFGPKHTGSLAVALALPMVVAVVLILVLSLPHLTLRQLEPSHASLKANWVAFVGVILALSGVEAIASLTGVMKLDAGTTLDKPRVARTARKAILAVAVEVVLGTSLLGWAVLSLPRTAELEQQLKTGWEDMLRFLGEQYGALAFGAGVGHVFGVAIGMIVGLVLLSAVNTAVAAMIGALYLMARDGEMPKSFTRLNRYGVPWLPMIAATVLPVLVLLFTQDMTFLANLYAIGVVGAIATNLGACFFNPKLPLKPHERILMGLTSAILAAVEMTIAYTKPDALFFAACILTLGMGLRGWAQRRAGFRTVLVHKEVAAQLAPESGQEARIELNPGEAILVAARGMTPVLQFALDEARLRASRLYVLFVQELAVVLPAPLSRRVSGRWQDNPQAARILSAMLKRGQEAHVQVIPLYAVSDRPSMTILDLCATLGIDYLILGTPQRGNLVKLLKGDVVTEVANHLPPNIHLLIFG
jgi:amino acid transporter/nucleotide-binding universal stress UspA family protein